MMKNVMVGNVGGTEVVGINDNGVGSVVCKLEDVPDIVEERDRLRELLTEYVKLVESDSSEDFLYRFHEIKQLLNGETK